MEIDQKIRSGSNEKKKENLTLWRNRPSMFVLPYLKEAQGEATKEGWDGRD